MERQQAKGGFTSLLACFGALLKKQTSKTIKQAFAAVKVKDVKQWVNKNLDGTLTSKRLATYREFRAASKRATKIIAPT